MWKGDLRIAAIMKGCQISGILKLLEFRAKSHERVMEKSYHDILINRSTCMFCAVGPKKYAAFCLSVGFQF